MKKLFTLVCALMGMTASVNAATIDDVKVCKHSYVLVADDYTNDGTYKLGKGELFGDDYFISITGNDKSTGKGKSNPAEIDAETGEYRYGEAFATKYGEYGEHYNSLRLKNAQDVIAMKVTAGSKLIFLLHGNNKSGTGARIPKIATDAKLENTLNAAPTADHEATPAGYKYEWTAADDYTIYIGSYNGDMFVGYIIVEANEAPGTPSVKVGPQTYENGLYFREVTCKPNKYELMGTELETVVTYTTDGTEPTATSERYTAPIKCYKDQAIKFQAFVDYGDGVPADKCEGADNEGIVSFSFNAPTINVDGANVTIASEYEGAKNYYKIGEGAETEGNSVTLTESATVSAYSVIANGSYATFTTKSTSKDAYVLNPIKAKKTITVSGNAVVDEEASATSTTGIIYKIENGVLNGADKMDFFVKNLEFGAVATAAGLGKYQVPEGQEAYIKMNNTNITFMVAEGDSVEVKVVCSKNACKNIDAEDANDRQCKVNVSGNVYGSDDILAQYDRKDAEDNVLETLDGNVIKFGLKAGTYTFQKFSGTGNILISSIEITPVEGGTGISNITADENADAPAYNIAGQRVNANAKGLVIRNGKKYVNK